MKLKNIENLFNEMDLNEIRYCHWKSNEHLKEALEGETDLDILFDISQKALVEDIFKKNKIHLFVAPWYRRYEGIFDYIGFDQATGKIFHIHTHFKLMIGEVGVKSFHLPWEEIILKNVVIDNDNNFKAASPDIEYLLLVVRTALKFQKFNNSSNKQIAGHFEVEARWLFERVNLKNVIAFSDKYLNEEISKLINEIITKPKFSVKFFSILRNKLVDFLSQQRKLNKSRVLLLQLTHLLLRIKNKSLKITGLKPQINKRRIQQKGIVITLMGPDGAGKSTQTNILTKELMKKVNVLFIYMGSGNGTISWHRKMLQSLILIIPKPKKKSEKQSHLIETESIKSIKNKSFIKQFGISILGISLAYEKKCKLKRIAKEKQKGGIVICDRYPQTTINGYNDGVKLYDNLKSYNIILRAMAKYELNCYLLSKNIYPDLVIKLSGDIKVLHFRRPEMSIEEIEKKQNGIINLPFHKPTQVLYIDVDRPIAEIKGNILIAISNQIALNNNI